MAIKVLMPQLGESIEEATITKWLKAEGDSVTEYEALVEVNTDKVDTEIPAPATGTLLKIMVPEEGSVVRVGMVLAWIGQAGDTVPMGSTFPYGDGAPQSSERAKIFDAKTTPMVEPTPEAGSVHTPPETGNRELGFISPVVAKIAAEYQVDLQQVAGTGLNGRITKKDVLRFIEGRGRGEEPTSAKTGAPIAAPGVSRSIPDTGTLDAVIPHTTIRRRIAEHMVLSKHTSPHVTTVFEADLSKVMAHRAAHKPAFERDGVKLTYTAYFVAATAAALKAYPMVNSSWSDAGLVLHRNINIGMATSLGEEGLIVPIIKSADELSLLGIARSVTDLANRARAKQLQPDEVSGGTFTITNHGISGSLFASPIINQPQCAILGVGKLQKRVMVLEDASGYDTISVRPMVYITLTFDHRILDGAVADYFLAKVVEKLENWS